MLSKLRPSGTQYARCRFVFWLILVSCGIALCLVCYGAFLAPATSRLSIAAAVTVLLAYAATAWFFLPPLSRRYPATLKVVERAGLAAGLVFAAEICLEYMFLPKNNTTWGLVEFAAVFLIYTCAGMWLAFERQSITEAVVGSTLSAVVSSVIWSGFLLATLYLFWQTSRQHAVFQAEGEFDDFRRSGMSNFQTFVTEDCFGAVFFHLILGPALASVFGLAGGAIGRALAVARKRIARNVVG